MERIPQDAKKHGIGCVIFSGGGDPLLNPYALSSARALKEYGIPTGINNQGYLLDDATPFDFIRYSVDAATPEMYQAIHRVPKKDGWERVNRNIAKHAEWRAKGEKIEMGLAFLITPLNWRETEPFCEWAQKFDPDFVHIRPAYLDADYLDREYPGGGALLRDEIIPQLRITAQDLTSRWPNVFFRIDKFEGFWTPKLYHKCRANPLIAVTSGDGAFLICQDRGIMKTEEYLRWGDYNKQEFSDIWWSQDHLNVMGSIDLENCPRCVENAYNEAIEHVFMDDKMKLAIL
jgi:MoaA/NifB/PqqE/SkfB family radical SAM enzyme